ncbi:MAG: hypothetical protein EOL89_10475 [Actinobacteria bacterium]|nr:hypothetical protein [Actinomycetota bacterium]
MLSDIEKVERNLSNFQGMLKSQRRTVVAPAVVKEVLRERGMMEQVQVASDRRARRLAELRELYGEAVARVPGAVDEDLLTLDELGFLLLG